MARDFNHVLSFVYGQPWAILPSKFREIEAALWYRLRHGEGRDHVRTETPRSAMKVDSEFNPSRGYAVAGSAAIVPIQGTISPRPSIFTEYSGGCSCDAIIAGVERASADGAIAAIVLDIDSPGGSVHGIPETAAVIRKARATKRVIAVANHTAASAAYWFASQAGEIVVTPAGWLGSIGVIMGRVDETRLEEMAGVKTTLITNTGSPFKSEGWPQVPMTDGEHEDLQQLVNKYATDFIADVAQGRGLKPAVIEREFGQGRMRTAAAAVAARMADRIATLEEVVAPYRRGGAARSMSRSSADRTAAFRRQVAADLARAGLPTSGRYTPAPAANTRPTPAPQRPASLPRPARLMRPSGTRYPWSLCVHEAGHAVAAYALGLRVERCSANAPGGAGFTEVLGQASPLAVATLFFAGGVAEAWLAPACDHDPFGPGGSAAGDMKKLARITCDPAIRQAGRAEAERLVSAHAHAIDRVALRLAHDGSIDEAGLAPLLVGTLTRPR